MKNLLELIESLKNTEVKNLVAQRIEEFKKAGKSDDNEIFKELCFCILTANSSAEKCMQIQEKIGKQFLSLPEAELAKKLKEIGHRFPNTRAGYITEARKHDVGIVNSMNNSPELRNWLVENVRGLGMKEASHFLRNIGYTDIAIVDFHIIDILTRHKLIEKPKTLTKKKYLEIEALLKKIADKSNLNLAELDLYLWYAETGKVLK